jgi:hypothetical protein
LRLDIKDHAVRRLECVDMKGSIELSRLVVEERDFRQKRK